MESVQTQGFSGHLGGVSAFVVGLFALHGETSHKLEMVVALDVLGPGEGVLVEPGKFSVPIDTSVHSLTGWRTRIAGVGLGAVEFLPAAVVHGVTSGNLQFKVIDNLPGQSQIGVEIVHYGLAVLVLGSLDRVETVIRRTCHLRIDKVVIQVIRIPGTNGLDRSVTPNGIHQPAGGGRGSLGICRGDTVCE